MINIFALDSDKRRVFQILTDHNNPAPNVQNLVWIDIVDPTSEDSEYILKNFNIHLPNLDDLGDIEASARFFELEGHLHLRTDFLIDENKVRNIRVAFILTDTILFSVHKEDLPVFRLVRMRAHNRPGTVNNAKDVLLDLYSTDIEHSADAIEEIYNRLEKISQTMLQPKLTDADATDVLHKITYEEDINRRVRGNIMDTRRALSFLMRHKLLNEDQQNETLQILRDIDSIENHTQYLFDKLNFITDTTVGFVNINQNKITKIFSVVSVALMPPTLVASIYGMNFPLPEFKWGIWGYVFVLGYMIASAILPMWFFKRKGWLH
jgi:magnesium transporter